MMKCSTTGKRMYSELDAKLVLSEVDRIEVQHRRRKYRETPQRSYRCPFCKAWHLTSQTKRSAA